jgi:alpha-tubulin suppressor-like RCC1 family protein
MCGIDTQMDAYCRGDNTYGQLGTGLPPGLPAIVVGGHQFLSIGAGGRHTCGVATAGALWCWGSNDKGALGIGILPNPSDAFTLKRETPAEVAAPR